MNHVRCFGYPMRLLCLAALLLGFAWTPQASATPCPLPDNGTGTADIPPVGCGYLSPADVHQMLQGLPAGTTVNFGIEHERFFNVVHTPGGSLGGEKEQFQSTLKMTLTGTGTLMGYSRLINLGAQCETHVAPRNLGAPIQSFDTDMFAIQGILPAGDPDFDLLRITAGTGFSMPSPGHTTLTQLPGGNWAIDSFFDITYRIDFVGHSPGPFSGMSGSTTGTIRMGAGEPAPSPIPPCTIVDNGSGTVDLPPQGCGYVSPYDLHVMIDGLPAGTTIRVAADHQKFFNIVRDTTGPGETEQFQSILVLDMNGTGSLNGFHKMATMQVQCRSHTNDHGSGPTQSFDTEMLNLQGQMVAIGDPDFDLLRITAGSGFSMPSPGHTTLTKLPGTPNWNVDSFFDITYRIDFIGHSPGPLAGRSGSTTGTIRMQTGQPSTTGVPIGDLQLPRFLKLANRPNPFSPGTTFEYRLTTPGYVSLSVYDAMGHRVRKLTDERLPAGPHAMLWDGRDDAGKRMVSGTYFVKLALDGRIVASAKTTLIK